MTNDKHEISRFGDRYQMCFTFLKIRTTLPVNLCSRGILRPISLELKFRFEILPYDRTEILSTSITFLSFKS